MSRSYLGVVIWFGLVAGLGVVGFSACSDGPAQPTDSANIPLMWQQEIDLALADPTLTQFERQVLSNPPITDAAMKQAEASYEACMSELGFTVTFSDSQYTIGPTQNGPYWHNMNGTGDAENQADSQCQPGTIRYILTIYQGMQSNPRGLSGAMLVKTCYANNGVPDGAELSDDAFTQFISDPAYFPNSPEADLCFYDPTGSTGLTVNVAEEYAHQRASGLDKTVTITDTPGAAPTPK